MRRAEPRWVLGGGAVLFAVVLGFVLSDYYVFLATSVLVAALIARSIGLVTGQAGMITLCQMSFAAVGGWAVAGLTANTGLPFLVQCLAGSLAAVPFGLAIGLPALRVRGVHLAVITLGFAVAVDLWINRRNFPGVEEGVAVIPSAPLDTPRSYYLFCLAVFVLVSWGLAVAGRRRLGAGWLAVRHSERASAALGLSVTRTKLGAFALSSAIAGLGGALMAGQVSLLTPQAFNPMTSLVAYAAAVMFGARYVEGALLAGGVGVALQELFRRLGIPLDFVDLIFGLGVIDALRRGHGGVAEQLRATLDRPSGVTAADRPALAPVPPQPPVAADAPSALRVRGLTVRYGSVTALDELDLDVPQGSVVALIGPNGAGKSSAIDAITGFARSTGEVAVLGRSCDGLPPHARARLGLRRAFQQDRTVPELSVGDYLALAAGRRLTVDELAEALAFVDGPGADARIGALDVGTRRLVEVAGVLVARPAMALLDEPAAGLAPEESRRLADRVREIPARFGAAVLIVEHDMEHVQAAASHVTVLDFGKVIAAGAPGDVLRDPTVVAAYLGADLEVAA
jgi:branched-chain amino acid transport system permease protein